MAENELLVMDLFKPKSKPQRLFYMEEERQQRMGKVSKVEREREREREKMEDGLEKSTSGSEVQEGDDSINHEKNQTDGTRKQHCAESILKPSLSGLKTIGNCKEEKEHKSTEAEMTKVIEENARLKKMLEQIEMEYQSLQVRFIDILQKEPRKSKNLSINHEDSEEPELVSLCLGRSTTDPKRDNTTNSSNKTRENEHEGLKLGLGYDFNGPKPNCPELTSNPSPENSLEEGTKEKKAGETCPPSTVLKTARSGEDEFSQQSNVKRARVSVRARCDTPTMNDGCQWRKYGQKIAKGNPCPRAYYRCTIAQACPVRKQVQRCAEDMSILITTYEGIHNHPLPVSATAMASTTSAAASMLMSGSSSSQQGIGLSTTSAPETNFLGLNFSLSDNPRTTPYYIPNSSASQAFPTITLDLTSRPNAHLNTYSSTRFPSTSFTFNSSESNILPTWANGYPSYGTPPYSRTNNGSISVGRPSQEQFYQPYTVKNDQALPQQYLTETLTKAITSDPSFQSVIAAAISTMVTGGGENQQNQRRETFGLTNSCASKAEIRDHIN